MWNGKSYNTKLASEAPKKKGFASTPEKGPAPSARAPIPTPRPKTEVTKVAPTGRDRFDAVPKKAAIVSSPVNKRLQADREKFIGTEKKRVNDDLRSLRGK